MQGRKIEGCGESLDIYPQVTPVLLVPIAPQLAVLVQRVAQPTSIASLKGKIPTPAPSLTRFTPLWDQILSLLILHLYHLREACVSLRLFRRIQGVTPFPPAVSAAFFWPTPLTVSLFCPLLSPSLEANYHSQPCSVWLDLQC